jgi:4-amino-4-deoxy-L-arabinose transferase-like glycosyltransferase
MTRAGPPIWLVLILGLSVLLRVAVAFYLGDSVPVGKDENSYSQLAARLAGGYGFSFDQAWYPFTPANVPTAHWSFLYTILVGSVYAVTGIHPLAVKLIQALATAILLPWMTYRLARRIFPRSPGQERQLGGEVLPLLAALLAAIYLYFVLYAAMIQTEALFIIAVVWSMERAMALGEIHRRGAARDEMGKDAWIAALGLGLGLGVATLLRQSILPWVAVLFAWLIWVNVRTFQRYNVPTFQRSNVQSLAPLVLSGTVMLACILPFTLRNYRVYGNFLLLNSNAGYAMYSAQHPMHGASFGEYDAAPLPEDLAENGLNEAQWDRELMRRGIGFILAEPGRYLRLSLSRIPDYFEFWPTRDTTLLHNIGRVGSFGLFLPFMLYGIWLAVRQARAGPPRRGWPEILASPLGLALLFMAFYSLLHILTWAMPRYRLPVDAVALPFAALGILDLIGRVPALRRMLGSNIRTLER